MQFQAVSEPSGFFGWKRLRTEKQGHCIYIVALEKSNSALRVLGELDGDKEDERSAGVINDQLVVLSNGTTLRRVTYKDSVTGKVYRFITNELTLPRGLIAFIYKLRWDIEKIFDPVKNKLIDGESLEELRQNVKKQLNATLMKQ